MGKMREKLMRFGRTNRGYSKAAQAKSGLFAGTYLNRCNTGVVHLPVHPLEGGGGGKEKIERSTRAPYIFSRAKLFFYQEKISFCPS